MSEPKITPRETDEVLASKFPLPQSGIRFVNDGNRETLPRDPLRPEKVAIVGTAPSSRLLAPFNDPTWTIWGSSPANGMGNIPRADAWFEMHCNFMWPEYQSYGVPYIKWLNEQNFPIMAQDQTLIPKALTFPMKEMVDKFGPYFFTSTFAWMMAYAIHVGVKEMALFGVDMASKDEYILQRPGGQYFITLAKQNGIKVFIPQESDLAQPPPLYGYTDGTPFGRKMAARKKELKDRHAQINAQLQTLQQQATYLGGALEDLEYVEMIWSGVALQS
jgi:hypothetical protein